LDLYVAPASNCSPPCIGDAADTITIAVNKAAAVTVNVMILIVFIITNSLLLENYGEPKSFGVHHRMIDPRAHLAGIATDVIEGPVFCWFDLGWVLNGQRQLFD
jgi:hypothetical protein